MTCYVDRLLYKKMLNGCQQKCRILARLQKVEKIFVMHIIERKYLKKIGRAVMLEVYIIEKYT